MGATSECLSEARATIEGGMPTQLRLGLRHVRGCSERFASQNGCEWGPSVCSAAAEHGHLSLLKWLCKNGCPWDSQTSRGAAIHNHLERLKWARHQQFPTPWCTHDYVLQGQVWYDSPSGPAQVGHGKGQRQRRLQVQAQQQAQVLSPGKIMRCPGGRRVMVVLCAMFGCIASRCTGRCRGWHVTPCMSRPGLPST